MNDQKRENLWKIVINGNSGTGKTSLLVRFCEGTFEDTNGKSVTIASEFKVKELKKFETTGKDIRLQVFDTAGQEKFRTITSSYYRGAAGALLVYDISNQVSFDAVNGWFEDITHYLEGVPLIIVGHKTDLEKNRVVSTAQGEELAKKLNAPFFEASAKTGEGVDELFFALTRMMNEQEAKLEKERNRGVVQLRQQTPNKKTRCYI